MGKAVAILVLACVASFGPAAAAEEEESLHERLKALLKEHPPAYGRLFATLEEIGESGEKDDVMALRRLLHHKDEAIAAGAVLGLERIDGEERERAMILLRKELHKPFRANGLAITEIVRVLAEREYEESFPHLRKLFLRAEDPYVLIALCRVFGADKDWRMFTDIYTVLHPKGGTRSVRVNQAGMPVGPVAGGFLDGDGHRRSGGAGVRAFRARYNRGGVTAEVNKELSDAAWLAIFAIIGHRLETREALQAWMTANRKLVRERAKEREKLARRRLKEARERRKAEERR